MLRRSLRQFCFSLVLTSPVMVLAQAEHLGPIHVDPQMGREGVRMSFKAPAPVHSSPEAVKILADLVAANGVDAKPQRPWHIELTYDEFDEDGDNVHSGTVEEFYVGPTKYRRVVKTDEVSQTEVATGSDLYRSGSQDWLARATLQAIDETFTPLYRTAQNADGSPDNLDWTVGGVKLSCVALRNGRVLSDNGLQKFCYEPGTAILRYTRGQGWDETVYNGIFEFDRRYLAHDIEVSHAGKPYLKITLAKIELAQLDPALLSPPPDSPGPLTGPVTVPGFLLLRKPGPLEFPHFPRGVHGKVTVRLTLSKQGNATKAEAIDGPEELRKPAEESAKKTQFEPFLILGKPTEVVTTTGYMIQ